MSYGQITRRNETEQEDREREGEGGGEEEGRLARSQHRISMGIVLPISC